jgi:hypothetical protein
MARYFAPISEADLKDKVLAGANVHFDSHELVEKLQKDIKVKFDLENFADGPSFGPKDLMGIHTLSNGLTFWGMCAGGDWEHPCFFICYYDGKKLRAYVPTEGNPWNTDTKQAYGNDDKADLKNAKKRWPERYIDPADDEWPGEIDAGDFSFDPKAIEQDIIKRILPLPGKKPSVSRTGKKTLQERIEACIYYGTGDEGYELFAEACRFCYMLNGLGDTENAETVCHWAEEMAESSKEWAKQEGWLDDNTKGVWGY